MGKIPERAANEAARDNSADQMRIDSYRVFWPYYLRQHARAGTRGLHFAGSGLALAFVALFLFTLDVRWVAAAIVVGYGLAWTGHFFVEHNRPAAFGHPLWSLISDFKMLAYWMSGRLPAELARAGVDAETAAPH